METAQAFNGENFSCLDQLSSLWDAAFYLFSILGFFQGDSRAAHWTGNRLSMVSSVKRVGVLSGTVFTHREDLHGRLLPVIGEGFNDCVAGPAVCAVDERVLESAVFRMHHFLMTVLADGNIRRDEDKAFALP